MSDSNPRPLYAPPVSPVGRPVAASVVSHPTLEQAEAWVAAVSTRTSRVKQLRPALAWVGRHRFTVAWVVWLLQFLTIEGLALRAPESQDDPRTLSRHTWVWFSVLQKGWGWRGRRIALVALMGWLSIHFIGGGRLM